MSKFIFSISRTLKPFLALMMVTMLATVTLAAAKEKQFRLVSIDDRFVVEVTLEDGGFGSLRTWMGTSRIQYKPTFRGYELTVMEDLTAISYPAMPWGQDGTLIQVTAEDQLKVIELKRRLDFKKAYSVDLKFARTLRGPNPLQDNGDLVIRRDHQSNVSRALFMELPSEHFGPRRTRALDSRKAMSMVLPGSDANSSLYLKLDPKAKMAEEIELEPSFSQKSINVMGYEFNHAGRQLVLENNERQLVYDFMMGGKGSKTAGFVILSSIEKEERQSMIKIDRWAQDLVRGPGFVDMKTFSGRYFDRHIDTEYFFFEDGIGGFESESLNPGQKQFFHWSLENGVVVGRRYIMENTPGYIEMVDTQERLKSCIDQSTNCRISQERLYFLIQKNGRDYSFYRTLRGFDLNTGDKTYELSDLQVMRKRW